MPPRKPTRKRSRGSRSSPSSDSGDGTPRPVGGPVFAQPEPTADPTQFKVKHPSDGPAYKQIDELNRQHKIEPLLFPPPRGGIEPRLTLEQVFGGNTAAIDKITRAGQIVFHATATAAARAVLKRKT
jgi:hypothetical protein